VVGALPRRKRLPSPFLPARGQTTEREAPQRLVHYRDNWYLDAWCHLRNDLRSFAWTAIVAPRSSSSRRQMPEKRLRPAPAGIFSAQGGVGEAALHAGAGALVSLEQWHPKQKARFEKDGNYLLEIPSPTAASW
jgi:predicted DNA-binding transcriptional regulator YafY